MTTVTLTIVETVTYGRDFDLAEIEEIAGKTLAECGHDVNVLTDAFRAGAENIRGWLEELEHDTADVQGQSWELSSEDFPPEYGMIRCPNCREWVDPPLNYPNKSYAMCDSCVHDARRSGWDPSQED